MRAQINIITLGVADMPRALAFYEQGLGWKRSDLSQGDIVFFPLNALVLALYPIDKLSEEIGQPIKSINDFSGLTLAYNTQSKEEVDRILTQINNIGGKVIKPAQDVFWGGYSGYFADPDGHVFEVAFNPFVEFNEHNQLVM